MRIAIIVDGRGKSGRLADVVSKASAAFVSGNHEVETIEASDSSSVSLAAYEYVIVGAEQQGFERRISDRLATFMKGARSAAGRRSAAFVLGSGLFPSKFLSTLMKSMEAEGMIVNDFSVVTLATIGTFIRGLPLQRRI
ncbi:MAG: hypothetical protein NT080_14670 [Spirochaetes bacterium]|nr:hypothetical protein [Spirochaetota bacterium]